MTATATLTATREKPAHLPVRALVGLFLTGFAAMLTEALPAGLLPEMGRTLGVSVAGAGQTVTIYAAGAAVAAIPLSRATARWPRKRVIQLTLVTLALTNTLTAVSGAYTLTLVVRFVAGLATGLIWSLLGGYAARLAPGDKQGRAIAIAMAGVPVSLAVGTPLGTLLGQAGGWQFAFCALAGLAALTMLWVRATLPAMEGQASGERPKVSTVLRIPGLRTILFVVATFIVAHNILYTYIADLLKHAGLDGQREWVLFTGFLRGCPGLQAGEESDSCGAGQGQPDRRQ
ncbi:MFS transporter, partial [Streptomyces sp. NPDC050743]|uniref:MFS transporter n=1 Tax=Streptomyces sp. NPDC050743 TaxID=3365634 RepID=UPI003792CEF2